MEVMVCLHMIMLSWILKTDIHSNKQHGICDPFGKVNIHLPSQQYTSHDNVGDDRNQHSGGSIANINADSTFTHVVAGEDDDNY